MKRTTTAVLAVLAFALIAAPVLRAERATDFQAIQKAVKQNPAYEEGKEVKWFKVLVTDTKTGKDKVRVTLPVALVELLLKCADDKDLNLKGRGCDIDVRALFAELKKVGPMALIEVLDHDELIKVWLE
jgi:selenocysteine-specific translation elongation factor